MEKRVFDQTPFFTASCYTDRSESDILSRLAVVPAQKGAVPARLFSNSADLQAIGDRQRIPLLVDGHIGEESPVNDMAEPLLILNEGVDPDLAGSAADIGDAADQDKAVGKICAALESEVVNGGCGHRESCMAAGARACHLIDP